MNTLKTIIAALAVTTALTACHSYANDNTSRPCIANEHGKKIGNSEITENRSMGADANPNGVLWDGITSPEERVGGNPCSEECTKKCDEKEAHHEAPAHH